jgi:soluble lytic murein transglycosylase-like protein
VRNIDVGCMQVNLGYHGKAFADLEAAFDPATNVAYAARFLSELFSKRRSWALAVGY